MEDVNIRPLREMKTGQTGTVVALTGNYDSRNRLVSMGIAVGCQLRLLVRGPGRYMVAVGEARIAIGSQAAENILIAVENTEDAFAQAVNRLKQIWAR